MGNAWTCFDVDGQAEYSRCQGYALYLVGPPRCGVLWAVETEWNHHRGSVSNAIDTFEPSIEGETATVPRETRQTYPPTWQCSATCRKTCQNIFRNHNERSYPTCRTLQILLLPTTICFDRWHTAWLIGISALMKNSKNWLIRGSSQKIHRFFETVFDNCQEDGNSILRA